MTAVEVATVVVGTVLMAFGALIILVAAIGLVRLPDMYLKASAVGTAAGLGIALIILGVLVLDFSWLNALKAAVAIVAQLLTSAVGTMAIARAGYLTGSRPVAGTSPDDLAAPPDRGAVRGESAADPSS